MFGAPRILRLTLCSLLASALSSAVALADDMRDLLELALDQPVEKLDIKDRPLPEAIAQLEKQTGVTLKVSPDVLELMPYGPRTHVNLAIENLPLRQGLTRLLDGLGLAMRADGGSVVVEPAPVLARLGRRITAQEVALLGKLAEGPWTADDQAHITVRAELPPGGPPDLMGELNKQLSSARGANALRSLESVTQNMGLVWVPDGDAVVLRTLEDDTQRRLDAPLDAAHQRVPLDRLLVDLGRRVGLTMHFAPGALQQVSASARNVDLVQKGVSVRQIFEMICGNTGLRYKVVPGGVEFTGPQSGAGVKGADGEPRPRLVRFSVPLGINGITVDVFIRENELPPQLQGLVDARTQQLLDGLSRAAATLPTVSPAGPDASDSTKGGPGRNNPLDDGH